MENNKKEMIWEQLEKIKKEITTVSRWLIETKNTHSWDETTEGYMLETLHRVVLISTTMQYSLVRPEKVSVQVEEYAGVVELVN